MTTAIRMLLLAIHLLVASLIGLIIGICRPFHPDNSRLCGRLYGFAAIWWLGLQIEADIALLKSIPAGAVIVSNHQSNFDLFILGVLVPVNTVSMGKSSLKWIPLFGQLYWLAGSLLVDRGNALKARKGLHNAIRTLKDKQTSIWIFPEGTRNLDAQLAPFKKGAFQMAVSAGVPIIPVCISRYRSQMRWGQWGAVTVRICALPAIDTNGVTRQEIGHLSTTCQSNMQTCVDRLTG
ncbi:lysophospholipid acyltransferase family protein [Pseudomonas putida]|uniref:lysophospholipid acyltransferase family protein n=1 Tax=Pseudomonas putida TaxID=303 RepID=UPI000E0E0328|nr:1-acylglycerol-3-phosphate O-acyltransferase [Pseudomonas putida]MCI1037981.1 1-acylglycerol-3-phosphate O-acyltransferase [Pseudomonas putida]WQE52181.1 1-acylglycerol-3-phosphate O-acyltransferase [Pseudomonas putida]GLO05667.1 1-acyl-sn-glycerol-3-phosphate acyltransferase [Pseudomonas putida]HDS1009099.1 1-acylglycerol-3-phosphate O-acyltransferase [Pseudomonas putida]